MNQNVFANQPPLTVQTTNHELWTENAERRWSARRRAL